MFWVEYYCPRQGPFWQRGKNPLPQLEQAIQFAMFLKPPAGSARVLDPTGNVVWEL